MAALTYVREVQEPRKREGVLTPDWSWKDLRTHFLLHCCDGKIARLATCRQLQTMRYAVEQRLMRIDGEDREVDKGGCDLMLKVRTLPSIPNLCLYSPTPRFSTDHQGRVRPALAHRCRVWQQEAAGRHDGGRRQVIRAEAGVGDREGSGGVMLPCVFLPRGAGYEVDIGDRPLLTRHVRGGAWGE